MGVCKGFAGTVAHASENVVGRKYPKRENHHTGVPRVGRKGSCGRASESSYPLPMVRLPQRSPGDAR